MFSLKNKRENLPGEPPSQTGKAWLVFAGTSVLLHFVFLLSLLTIQHFDVPREKTPPAVQVDLVSYSPDFSDRPAAEAPGDSAPAENTPETAAEDKQVSVEKSSESTPEPDRSPRVIKPDISLKSKPENLEKLIAEKKEEKKEQKDKKKEEKTSLKKKTYEPEKVIEAARETMEKTVEKQSDDQLKQALQRLEKEVESGREEKSGSSGDEKSETGRGGNTAVSIYNSMLAVAVQQNWVFNSRLARIEENENSPVVTVVIKILKNGEIADIWIETRSGNRYLDQSAVRAVKKAAPFPPLPQGYTSYNVGMRFDPRGVRGS